MGTESLLNHIIGRIETLKECHIGELRYAMALEDEIDELRKKITVLERRIETLKRLPRTSRKNA